MSDLQFGSFQVSNVFIAAKFDFELLLGRFLGHKSPQTHPSLHEGSSQNMFAEVADNVFLLIYFSVEVVRYIT